jgi:NhaP-type Na+/H+ or K+/H+ antiporter
MHVVGDGAESIIFVVLGVELVRSVDLGWNTGFVLTAIIIALVARAAGVYGLIGLINPYRQGDSRFSMGDRFILSYGGLRGAIAFALASVLLQDKQLCAEMGGEPFTPFPHRDLFVSTTIAIVVFTVLVQGSTIRPVRPCNHDLLAALMLSCLAGCESVLTLLHSS